MLFWGKYCSRKAKYGSNFEIQNGRRRNTQKKKNKQTNKQTNKKKQGEEIGFVHYSIKKTKSIVSINVTSFALDNIFPTS